MEKDRIINDILYKGSDFIGPRTLQDIKFIGPRELSDSYGFRTLNCLIKGDHFIGPPTLEAYIFKSELNNFIKHRGNSDKSKEGKSIKRAYISDTKVNKNLYNIDLEGVVLSDKEMQFVDENLQRLQDFLGVIDSIEDGVVRVEMSDGGFKELNTCNKNLKEGLKVLIIKDHIEVLGEGENKGDIIDLQNRLFND